MITYYIYILSYILSDNIYTHNIIYIVCVYIHIHMGSNKSRKCCRKILRLSLPSPCTGTRRGRRAAGAGSTEPSGRALPGQPPAPPELPCPHRAHPARDTPARPRLSRTTCTGGPGGPGLPPALPGSAIATAPRGGAGGTTTETEERAAGRGSAGGGSRASVPSLSPGPSP